MLLLPHNAAESHCKNLVLQIDHNAKPTQYFVYMLSLLPEHGHKKVLQSLPSITCPVSTNSMRREITFSVDVASTFVTKSAWLLISDDLQLISALSESIVSLFTNLGVTVNWEWTTIDQLPWRSQILFSLIRDITHV
ncbi:hypothetical protein EV1_006193 [Malus domestica]